LPFGGFVFAEVESGSPVSWTSAELVSWLGRVSVVAPLAAFGAACAEVSEREASPAAESASASDERRRAMSDVMVDE